MRSPVASFKYEEALPWQEGKTSVLALDEASSVVPLESNGATNQFHG
jgi:hypothetical protein